MSNKDQIISQVLHALDMISPGSSQELRSFINKIKQQGSGTVSFNIKLEDPSKLDLVKQLVNSALVVTLDQNKVGGDRSKLRREDLDAAFQNILPYLSYFYPNNFPLMEGTIALALFESMVAMGIPQAYLINMERLLLNSYSKTNDLPKLVVPEGDTSPVSASFETAKEIKPNQLSQALEEALNSNKAVDIQSLVTGVASPATIALKVVENLPKLDAGILADAQRTFDHVPSITKVDGQVLTVETPNDDTLKITIGSDITNSAKNMIEKILSVGPPPAPPQPQALIPKLNSNFFSKKLKTNSDLQNRFAKQAELSSYDGVGTATKGSFFGRLFGTTSKPNIPVPTVPLVSSYSSVSSHGWEPLPYSHEVWNKPVSRRRKSVGKVRKSSNKRKSTKKKSYKKSTRISVRKSARKSSRKACPPHQARSQTSHRCRSKVRK